MSEDRREGFGPWLRRWAGVITSLATITLVGVAAAVRLDAAVEGNRESIDRLEESLIYHVDGPGHATSRTATATIQATLAEILRRLERIEAKQDAGR